MCTSFVRLLGAPIIARLAMARTLQEKLQGFPNLTHTHTHTQIEMREAQQSRLTAGLIKSFPCASKNDKQRQTAGIGRQRSTVGSTVAFTEDRSAYG